MVVRLQFGAGRDQWEMCNHSPVVVVKRRLLPSKPYHARNVLRQLMSVMILSQSNFLEIQFILALSLYGDTQNFFLFEIQEALLILTQGSLRFTAARILKNYWA